MGAIGVGAEAFRILRTNLELARLERDDMSVILVVGAVERESKSTTRTAGISGTFLSEFGGLLTHLPRIGAYHGPTAGTWETARRRGELGM